jgi:chromosome partitioning protein
MQTLLIGNQKGGVGKSAIATQFALYAAQRGFRVLAIDLDHQANFSTPLLRSGVFTQTGLSETLFDTEHPGVWKLPSARCSLLAASAHLSALERNGGAHNLYASLLRDACQEVFATHFDLCVIDVNPNPDIRFGAAMIAANHFLVPIQLNQEAIDGVRSVLEHPRFGYARIKAGFNPTLNLLGLLPNLFEATPFQKANLVAIIAQYSAHLFSYADGRGSQSFACIPTRTAIAEAQASGTFIGAGKKTSFRDTWKYLAPLFAALETKMGIVAPVDVVPTTLLSTKAADPEDNVRSCAAMVET